MGYGGRMRADIAKSSGAPQLTGRLSITTLFTVHILDFYKEMHRCCDRSYHFQSRAPRQRL